MSLELQFTITLQLIVATLLSMIIGMDRERNHKSAGLRTHMLTGLGACLFTSLSFHAFPEGDPTRIASNIVTGIGFLGAGTIVRRGNEAGDLTTAASIWSTAAVGMAVGTNAWFLAMSATLIIWGILAVIRLYEGNKTQAEQIKSENPPK
jgi:putative Mg2+ transporter-C (MgtC) family protein